MSAKGLELNERDILILNTVYRFRYCLGRHIKELAGFNGARACDRRLKKLVDNKYLERKKYFYGVPYIYTVAHKGRLLIGVNKRAEKIRLDQLRHDMIVIDCINYFMRKYNITLEHITTEKELHSKDGFSVRKHVPDFIIYYDEKGSAFEVELTKKNKEVLEKNIKTNFLNYDFQTWITDDNKIFELLQFFQNKYSNMNVVRLEEIKNLE